jgi:hypothetical protein
MFHRCALFQSFKSYDEKSEKLCCFKSLESSVVVGKNFPFVLRIEACDRFEPGNRVELSRGIAIAVVGTDSQIVFARSPCWASFGFDTGPHWRCRELTDDCDPLLHTPTFH